MKFSFVVNFIEKLKAKRRIPDEVYRLIDTVHRRYSQLNFNNGEFGGLSKKEKLSKLIQIINNDSDIKRLNSLSFIGSIIAFMGSKGGKGYTASYGGMGVNLCLGRDGLSVHYWDDMDIRSLGEKPNSKIIDEDVPATPKVLEKYDEKFDVEKLRNAVTYYTNKENYIERAAVFKKFR